METRHILAIDPGPHCGLAIAYGWEDGLTAYESRTVNGREIWRVVHQRDWHTIICESYGSAGPLTRDGAETLRIIGGIEALCVDRLLTLIFQPPQRRMPYEKDAQSRIPGSKTAKRHEIAALAHLLAWQARSNYDTGSLSSTSTDSPDPSA